MFLLMFGFSLATITLQVLMTDMIIAFNLSGAWQAVFPSMFLCGGMLAVTFLPFIKGRIAKTSMLSISALTMAATLFVLGFAQAAFAAAALALILGIFAGWIDSYANSTIIDIHKTDSRKYVGYLHASFCLAAISLPFLIHFLQFKLFLNWRGICFAISAAILILSLRFIVTARANKKVLDAESQERRLTIKEIKTFMRDKYYVLMTLCYGLYCLSQNALSIWIFHYAKTVYPNPEILASLTLSIFWLGGFLSRMLYHLIKMEQMKLFVLSIGFSIAVHMIGILSHNPAIFFISTLIMSLTSGLGFPLLVNETLIRYRGNTSMALTGLHFFGKAGAFIMPLIMGMAAAKNIHFAILLTDITCLAAVLIAVIILFSGGKKLPTI